MRTHDSLERLSAAGRPLLADVESTVDAAAEERILERIVTSDRHAVRRRRPQLVLVIAGLAIVVAAVTAVATRGHTTPPIAKTGGNQHVALTGVRLQAAGYHFRTPAGYTASDSSCSAPSSSSGPRGISKSGPVTVMNGFAAAASADGGCVEAFFLIPGGPGAQTPNPPPGQPVDVGSYHGYYDPQGDAGANLYVELPKAGPAAAAPVFLVLYAHGLTEDQLVAVAQSGLPSSG